MPADEAVTIKNRVARAYNDTDVKWGLSTDVIAMLENSGSLIIAPDEWLTVAARDNAQGNRFVASDPSDVTTVVLRVKGSDLAAFQAGWWVFAGISLVAAASRGNPSSSGT